MSELKTIKILAQDLKENDILSISDGKYFSEVFIVNSIPTLGGTVISVLSKGIHGGSDEFKFKSDTLIEVSRR